VDSASAPSMTSAVRLMARIGASALATTLCRHKIVMRWHAARASKTTNCHQARLWGVESGRSRAKRVVVSRSPTLSLITRKFARQSHAAVQASRNAVSYRLWRTQRVGSIPIARATFLDSAAIQIPANRKSTAATIVSRSDARSPATGPSSRAGMPETCGVSIR
jgi:hypothetical protein